MNNRPSQHDPVGTAARPDPRRCEIADYPIIGSISARYADMDANAHVNNIALETMHENSRAELVARVFPGAYDPRQPIRLVTSQNVVHFLAEARWPTVLRTGAGVARIGRTSFVASSVLFEDDICVSVCNAVLVHLDETGPVPIPEDAVEALRSVLVGWASR